jgi:hypothetical protein
MHLLELIGALRLTRKQLGSLFLGLGIAFSSGLVHLSASADSPAPDTSSLQAKPATLVELPHTDGYGLLPKPPAFTEEESERLFTEGRLACQSNCVTPFGEVLGIADGAQGRSNCVSTCIRPEFSFLDLKSGEVSVHKENPEKENLHYIGVTYQCVEYARKWWMKNKDITFGSIDSAHEIIYLTEGTYIRSQETFPLARSINGTAKRPPQRGDLVIYYPDRDDPEWRHGHVAVVVGVELEEGIVALAEENYANEPWENPEAFARRIRLFEVGGRYTLVDVPMTANKNPDGGRISGWIYPLSEE